MSGVTYSLCFFLLAAVPPNVEKLLDKHLRARGGLKAYQNAKTRRTVALTRLSGMELKTVTLESPPGGKFYQVVEHPTAGRIEVGFDGRRVWQRSAAMQGMLQEEDPRARALLRAGRAAEFWEYKKDDRRFEYGGKELFEGGEYEVLHTSFTVQTGADLPAKYYFDSAGMLRFIIAGADAATRLHFSDFREVDGIKYPFHTRFTAPQSSVETQVQEIRHNVPLETSVFEYREALPERKP